MSSNTPTFIAPKQAAFTLGVVQEGKLSEGSPNTPTLIAPKQAAFNLGVVWGGSTVKGHPTYRHSSHQNRQHLP